MGGKTINVDIRAALGARYFLSQDNDCHWFVIPVARQREWDLWREIDSDDERAWTPPDFAQAIGGSPSTVTFCAPEFS